MLHRHCNRFIRHAAREGGNVPVDVVPRANLILRRILAFILLPTMVLISFSETHGVIVLPDIVHFLFTALISLISVYLWAKNPSPFRHVYLLSSIFLTIASIIIYTLYVQLEIRQLLYLQYLSNLLTIAFILLLLYTPLIPQIEPKKLITK